VRTEGRAERRFNHGTEVPYHMGSSVRKRGFGN